MNQPKTIPQWSDEILDYLLQKRASDPSLKFWLRQQKGEKLDNGYWFQGNEDYLFIGVVKGSGGFNMTKSLGFVLGLDKDQNPHFWIEIIFKEGERESIQACYRQIVEELDFVKNGPTRYRRFYPSTNVFSNLETFLSTHLPQINAIIKDRNLENELLIPDDKFEKKLQNTLSLRKNIYKSMKNTNSPLNQIFYGPPGTGKTYHTINEALKIVDPVFYAEHQNDRHKLKERFQALLFNQDNEGEGQIGFTTFHQSFSYEDFIEGIKPVEPEEEDTYLKYVIEDGIFKRICKDAQRTKKVTLQVEDEETKLTPEIFKEYYAAFAEPLPPKTAKDSPVVMYTSSSQKAPFKLYKNLNNSIVVKAGAKQTPMAMSAKELSQVFFNDKAPRYRSYEKLIIEKILENAEYKETAQENEGKNYVLIIDEINRGNVSSIFGELITLIEKDKRAGGNEALSVILPYSKQVFSVPSNVYIIGTMNTADRSIEALDTALRRRFSFQEMPPIPALISNDMEGINLSQMLETINARIEKLIDKDHKIGHAYFMGIQTKADLKAVFQDKVIPLLEEYFFGDLGKISLVLGKSFIRKEGDNATVTFAKDHDYDDSLAADLLERAVYKVTPSDEWDFEAIYASI